MSDGEHRCHQFIEMMFGTRERFEYQECIDCGTIQRLSDVVDESRFYPDGYYSFADVRRNSRVTAIRDAHALGTKSILGAVASFVRYDPIIGVIGDFGIDPSSRVLDVGCGSGKLLHRMSAAGFKSLTGVDPYISEPTSGAVTIHKSDLRKLSGEFDFIMFNHSLEHVPDPHQSLSAAKRLLAPRGRILVRIPTSSSHAWMEYGSNWVQLDAPRHLVIPSRKGMNALAERCGLSVRQSVDDSTAFQFWGSEMYRKSKPLASSGPNDVFSRHELRRFAKRAAKLNIEQQGDQVAFLLTAA
ncbi:MULTISPECIES: class I SAM-dependent methyltransferase [unclassified Bradyrhizobium]|uniref:class I SAM-dependent methyltransferase n=1 Tax=unclassified Bradyrhizobium TaxID=2631580 RepID=UPI001FFB43FE|nr:MULTISPECIES: class I SAM-dependent methyltransferase [unclassified Bradyrhizobium]MCK1709639.1 class I SAM-dependent methyltransferase [Bradyrhizobium sp. 143]MCK1731594.1 class I SAM-dependent methyltransferase [Bradyrhizobium sp. 142]